ncbi:MAG: hypothetical protein ACUVSV_11160 [Armatimonadota bacterium]
MAVVVPKKSYTIDDLWDLSHRTGKRYELVRGELRELTPPGWETWADNGCWSRPRSV